jgi:hypothetical protein
MGRYRFSAAICAFKTYIYRLTSLVINCQGVDNLFLTIFSNFLLLGAMKYRADQKVIIKQNNGINRHITNNFMQFMGIILKSLMIYAKYGQI